MKVIPRRSIDQYSRMVMMFFDWTYALVVTLIAMSYYKTRSGYLYETFNKPSISKYHC